MTAKYLLGATFVAALIIFFWGAFSHTALPEPVQVVKSNPAIVDAVRAGTNGNAIYFEPHGIFMAVSLNPDGSEKSVNMGPLLGMEFLSNLVCGFLLAVLLAKARRSTVAGYGALGFVAGLLVWFAEDVSFWNWYGFSPAFTLFSIVDTPVGCALAGLAVGWMIRKWFPEVGAEPGVTSAARV